MACKGRGMDSGSSVGSDVRHGGDMEVRVLEALKEEEMKSRNRCWASRMYHQSANLLSVSQSVEEPVSISVSQSHL